MFVICVAGWVTKNLMYNKFRYYFIRQVKYWWFRGDWYNLLLRELNYTFVAFDFTSKQTFCNLGRQQFVSREMSSRRSKVQRQAFCNLGRQRATRACLPKLQNVCLCNLERRLLVSREINYCLPKLQNVCLEVKSKATKT